MGYVAIGRINKKYIETFILLTFSGGIIYPVWLRILVTFVIPIAVATTVPLQGLRGDLTLGRVLMFVAIGIVSFLIASQVWKRGLKQYSGASS